MSKRSLFTDADKFIGADLHIHTPASSCYKGNKTDDEYLNILRKYHENKIFVLGITDHNTILGYKKFATIRSDLELRLTTLSKYVDKHPDLSTEIISIENDLSLFTSMLILPGVELEVNPGIHLLFLFDDKTDIKIIDNFIVECGYNEETQGKEEVKTLPSCDVIEALAKASKLNALAIAAHADSDKGIYNDLKNGKFRAAVFSASSLKAISYNSAKTREKIQQLFLNTAYKRTEPVAFIQSSDFHGEDDKIGKNITYVKIRNLSFDDLQNALKNPNECISPTEHPEIINIINQFLEDPNTICCESCATEEDIKNIAISACAILNQGYGTLLIGVSNSTKSPFGISSQILQQNDPVEYILNNLTPKYPSYEFTASKFPFGEKEIVAIKLANKSISFFTYNKDKDVYILDKENIRTVTIQEISKLTQDSVLDKLTNYQTKFTSKLNKLTKEITLLSKSIVNFKIIQNIDSYSISLSDLVKVDVADPSDFIDKLSKFGNGESEGNVIFVDKTMPRLSSANLRCSAPRISEVPSENLQSFELKKETLIVVPGGGAYFVSQVDQWFLLYSKGSEPPLILTENFISQEGPSFTKLILGWLKSSALLWYCLETFENTDIYNPTIFNKIPVPLNYIIRKSKEIIECIDNIMSKEMAFLDDISNLKDDALEDEMIKKFNKDMDYYYRKIDEYIFESLDINEEQKQIIYNTLELNETYFSKPD